MIVYYRVARVNGVLDIDYEYLIHGTAVSPTEGVVHLRPCKPRPSWVVISKDEFDAHIPHESPQDNNEPMPPSQSQLIGLLIVQQTLANAEAKQQFDAIGKGMVQLMLKGGA